MYKITDEASLRDAIESYLHFYTYERPQERFNGKTPAEVRQEALLTGTPKINMMDTTIDKVKGDHCLCDHLFV